MTLILCSLTSGFYLQNFLSFMAKIYTMCFYVIVQLFISTPRWIFTLDFAIFFEIYAFWPGVDMLSLFGVKHNSPCLWSVYSLSHDQTLFGGLFKTKTKSYLSFLGKSDVYFKDGGLNWVEFVEFWLFVMRWSSTFFVWEVIYFDIRKKISVFVYNVCDMILLNRSNRLVWCNEKCNSLSRIYSSIWRFEGEGLIFLIFNI